MKSLKFWMNFYNQTWIKMQKKYFNRKISFLILEFLKIIGKYRLLHRCLSTRTRSFSPPVSKGMLKMNKIVKKRNWKSTSLKGKLKLKRKRSNKQRKCLKKTLSSTPKAITLFYRLIKKRWERAWWINKRLWVDLKYPKKPNPTTKANIATLAEQNSKTTGHIFS